LEQEVRDAAVEVGGLEGNPLAEHPRVHPVLLLRHPLRLDGRVADREGHADAVRSAEEAAEYEHQIPVTIVRPVPRLPHCGTELHLVDRAYRPYEAVRRGTLGE